MMDVVFALQALQKKISEILFGELKEWLFYEDGDDFDSAVDKLGKIAKDVVGNSNHRLLLHFFAKLLFDETIDTIVVLARRAHILMRLYLPLVYAENKNDLKKLELFDKKIGNIISDKDMELNLNKDKLNGSIAVIDECVIFGRILDFYAKAIDAIKAEHGIKGGDTKLWACMGRYNMPFFKTAADKKNVLIKEVCHGGKATRTEINFIIRTHRRLQKDFIYKILRLFYSVGIPFTPILPIALLNQTETAAFIEKIDPSGGGDGQYRCIKRRFAYTDYFIVYGKSIGDNKQCFRIVKNIHTGKSFLLPAILQPSLKIKHLQGENIREPGNYSNLFEFFDEMGGLYAKTRYRLIAYFLEDDYLRQTVRDVLGGQTPITYVNNGLHEHLNRQIRSGIEMLHSGEYESECKINGIIEDCKAFVANHPASLCSDGYLENPDISDSAKKYRKITNDYINYMSSPENWEEIKEDFKDEDYIYSLNALTAYILRLSIEEVCDFNYAVNKDRRTGYDEVRYFMDEFCRIKTGAGDTESEYLANEMFTMLVLCLDFGILTMNSQDYDIELKDSKDYFGVMLRPGEEGLVVPQSLAFAYGHYSDIDDCDDGSDAEYKNKMRGLLVSELLDYWQKNNLPKTTHLHKIFHDENGEPIKEVNKIGEMAEFLQAAMYGKGKIGIDDDEMCLKIAAGARMRYIEGRL